MRLTEPEIQAIRDLAREVAGGQVRVRVFVSRFDDAARGGEDVSTGVARDARAKS